MSYSRAAFLKYLQRRGIQILSRNDWRERVIHLHNPTNGCEAFISAMPGDDRIEYATIIRVLQRLGINELPGDKDLLPD